jgi:hypothetical protein
MRLIHSRTQGTATTTFAAALAISLAASAASAQTVAVGDIVQTNLNGLPVIGEVTRSVGAFADLNAGQNNRIPLVSVENMKVVQKAGTGGKSSCAVGDSVQVRSLANTIVPGRIMKTNGAYCEIDSSGSGFTGWSKCADMVRPSAGTCAPPTTAAQGRPGGAAAAAGPQPPRPGLTSCAGKIEGRYSTAAGIGLSIEFRSGKATLKGPLVDPEVVECWTSGAKIVLHNPKEPNDLELDVNKDGSIDTPFGEIRKKGD